MAVNINDYSSDFDNEYMQTYNVQEGDIIVFEFLSVIASNLLLEW